MAIAQKAFTVRRNVKGKDGRSYSIVFKLNGVSVGVLNYNTPTDADASMTLECEFLLNGEPYNSKSCRLGCYDAGGTLMGSEITSTDASSIVANGGNLYLSKGCKNIQCSFVTDGGGEHTESLTVVLDGINGEDACYIRVTSTAGVAYKNHVINTTLAAKVFRGSEDVTDRCAGAGFTWFYGDSTTAYATGTAAITLSGRPESNDTSKWRCVYEGELASKQYGLVFDGKTLVYDGKSVVAYGG